MLKRCAYTALIGDYEQLNEQAVARDSSLPFICLTDDPDLRSESWDIRLVEPVFPMDPVRSQRELKIRAYVHLAEFDQSLYIDNSVILKVKPEQLFEAFFVDAVMAQPIHSFRETLLDEFLEIVRLGFDDANRVFEQCNHYALSAPDVLEEKPYWSAILLRDHRDPDVRKMAEIWAAHVFRYSRRDQLSINMAFRQAGLAPRPIEIDNFESWFHQWPVISGRDRSKGMRDAATSLSPLVFQLRKSEQALAASERTLAEKEQALAALEQARLAEAQDRDERLADEQKARAEVEAALATRERELEQTRAERDAARSELDQSRARGTELWQRYVTLRKRSILRLPRWAVRRD